MNRPAVSVVVPVHQAGPFIESTLTSVCDQDLGSEQLEIVLVDDGSSDDGMAVAAATLAARGRRATTLRHDAPQGPSAARNQGWRAATAEWIQFLDADDVLAPGKCRVQLEAAHRASAQVAVICSSWARSIGAGRPGEPVPDVNAVTTPEFGADPLIDVLRADNFIAVGSYLVRRSAVEQVGGFDESLWLVEDVDFLMRLAMAGWTFERAGGQDPLFWYREVTGSLSRRDEREFVEACLRNTRSAEAFWRQTAALTDGRRRCLARLYSHGARFLAEHDVPAFNALVKHIDALDPDFVPEEPAALRRLSRLVGYRAAERLAVRYRRVKRVVSQ